MSPATPPGAAQPPGIRVHRGGAVGVAAGVAMLGGDLDDYDLFFTVLAIVCGVAGLAALGMVTHKKEN